MRDRTSMMPPINGIVLAAGRSRRIGRSKPLLRARGRSAAAPLTPPGEAGEAGGEGEGERTTRALRAGRAGAGGGREGGADDSETFLERAVHRLAAGGCGSVTVVVAARDEPVRHLADALGATVIENAEPDSQPIDSVRLAIPSTARAGADSAAILVLPVDVPLVTTATIAAVIEAFAARRASIVAPSYRGELGHPVLIARPLFDSIMTEPLEQGLRSLLESHHNDIDAVPVDDPGTLIDIDTADDYETFIGRAH